MARGTLKDAIPFFDHAIELDPSGGFSIHADLFAQIYCHLFC
jgi:hypothetical protein